MENVLKDQNFPSPAKIAKPRLPEIVHRERLYRLLDQGSEYPSFWVTGPAGSGKTTLVSDYIAGRKLPCLWYQIDQGDNDVATFFHYFSLASERISSKSRPPPPRFTPEYLTDIFMFALRYFEGLYARLKANSAIVLDNYQEVPSDSPIHDVICQALTALPQGLHLFILSREAHHAAFSRLRANRMMTTIGWEQIRLTEKETEAIACLQMGKKLPRESVTRLHRVTGGWVAGLILMLSGEGAEKGKAKRIGKQKPDEIFDYLAREVLDSIELDARNLLFKTALFPHMTSRMAESLTGLSHAGRVFSRLHRGHMFVEKRLQRRVSYQYHPLFREFLLVRLREIYSKEDLRELECRAAIILEEDGQIEAAISLLCHGECWEDAVSFIVKHAPALLSQGRTNPLRQWLDKLPDEWLVLEPWLPYWMGACDLSSDPLTGRSGFEKAFERFEAKGDRAGLLLAWSGIVESIFYGFDGFPLLDRWIAVLEGHIRETPTFPTKEIEARVVFAMFSALTFRQPHHPHMRSWADRAMRLAHEDIDARAKAYAYSQLIFYHMMMGNHGAGSAVLEALAQLKDAGLRDPLVCIDVLAVKVLYFLNIRSHEECLDMVFEGLEFSSKSGVHVMDLMFLGWGAWSAVRADDSKTAAEFLERLGATQGYLRPHEGSFYHFLMSQKAVADKNFHKAAQHADIALNMVENLGIPINTCIVKLSRAQAMHGLGRAEEGEKRLEQALGIARKMGSRMLEFSALLLRAKMALDRGEEESALTGIRDALSLGKENGYFISMVGQASDMTTICSKALEAGIEVDYVRELIQRQGLIPEKPRILNRRWPWPVRVVTLGAFNLFINGQPFASPGRSPNKTLSLLKALIAFGENGVSETRVQDALWPDLEGDRGHNVFSTTLHRLRKILGSKGAVELNHGKIALSDRYCWVDARYFLKNAELWGMARETGKEGDEETVRMMEETLLIYNGAFLPDDDDPWVIPIRQRLNMEFVECVKRLGRHYEKAGQPEKAILCYTRGLKIDPLIEDFYRRLMACYCKAGDHSKARQTFMRCRETLTRVLGVEPSKKTEALLFKT